MADPESNSPEYKELLRLLILLNSNVNFISLSLKEISSHKVLSPDYLDRLTAAAKQVEGYVNKDNPR